MRKRTSVPLVGLEPTIFGLKGLGEPSDLHVCVRARGTGPVASVRWWDSPWDTDRLHPPPERRWLLGASHPVGSVVSTVTTHEVVVGVVGAAEVALEAKVAELEAELVGMRQLVRAAGEMLVSGSMASERRVEVGQGLAGHRAELSVGFDGVEDGHGGN